MGQDTYKGHDTSWTRPGQGYVAVTPSDTTEYDPPLRGIIVGVAGAVALVGPGDPDLAAVTITTLVAGVVHPLAASKVMSTGTTATGITGVY